MVDSGTALIGATQHRQFGSVKLLLQRLQQQHPETGRSHAVSWLWLSQAPPPAVGGGKNTTTLAPLAVLSPIVERRVARRDARLTSLFRSVATWQH